MIFSYQSSSSGWKKGDIRMWTKSLSEIPNGWQLCDGTNGTPPLVNRAIVGAGGEFKVGQQFGTKGTTPTISIAGHTLAGAQMPSHTHGIGVSHNGGAGISRPYGTRDGNVHGTIASNASGGNAAHSHSANASFVSSYQPSVAVYFIMKMR